MMRLFAGATVLLLVLTNARSVKTNTPTKVSSSALPPLSSIPHSISFPPKGSNIPRRKRLIAQRKQRRDLGIQPPGEERGDFPRAQDISRWIWLKETSLQVSWSPKFSIALNDAVSAYKLGLTEFPPEGALPLNRTAIIHQPRHLQHMFSGLSSSSDYEGQFSALVGQHHWPYHLLSFTHTPPAVRQGVSEDDATYLPPSETSDLEEVTVGVTLHWAETPFIRSERVMGTTVVKSVSPPHSPHPPRPQSYRVRIWDGQTVVQEQWSTPRGNESLNTGLVNPMGPQVTVTGLPLDRQFKVTIEALNTTGDVTTSLTSLLYTGSFHVADGEQTTDGVNWCYSAMQVRCPGGTERCVSPFWLCDGSNDCPDGADEAGCDASSPPCNEGFKCYGDDKCLPNSWKCDGVQDCLDGEDELDCSSCEDETHLMCGAGGECLNKTETCDGKLNCIDGWDESVAVCGHKIDRGHKYITNYQIRRSKDIMEEAEAHCTEGAIPCKTGGPCVDMSQLCDGLTDCPGGEDEMLTVCALVRKTIADHLGVNQRRDHLEPKKTVTNLEGDLEVSVVGTESVTDVSMKEATTFPLMNSTTLSVVNSTTLPLIDSSEGSTEIEANHELVTDVIPVRENDHNVISNTSDVTDRNIDDAHRAKSNQSKSTDKDRTVMEDIDEYLDFRPTMIPTVKSNSSDTLPKKKSVVDDYSYEYKFGFDEEEDENYSVVKITEDPEAKAIQKNLSEAMNNSLDQPISTPEALNQRRIEEKIGNGIETSAKTMTTETPELQMITCAKDEFDCGGGWCVPSFWLCDGHFDCQDGEDEDPTICDPSLSSTVASTTTKKSLSATCSVEEWTCPTGHCIPQEFFCDGVLDCPEGFDEVSGCSFKDIIDYDDYLTDYGYDFDYDKTMKPLIVQPTVSSTASADTSTVSTVNKTDPGITMTAESVSESIASTTFSSEEITGTSTIINDFRNEKKLPHIIIPKKITSETVSETTTTQELHFNPTTTTQKLDFNQTTTTQELDFNQTTTTQELDFNPTTTTQELDFNQTATDGPLPDTVTVTGTVYTVTESTTDNEIRFEPTDYLVNITEYEVNPSRDNISKSDDNITIIEDAELVEVTDTDTELVGDTKISSLIPSLSGRMMADISKMSMEMMNYLPSVNETQNQTTFSASISEIVSTEATQIESLEEVDSLKKENQIEKDLPSTFTDFLASSSTLAPKTVTNEKNETKKHDSNKNIADITSSKVEKIKSKSSDKMLSQPRNSPEFRISLLPSNEKIESESSPKSSHVKLNKSKIYDIPIKTNGFLKGISNYHKSYGISNDIHKSPPKPKSRNLLQDKPKNSQYFKTSISSAFDPSANPTVTIAATTDKDGKVVFTTHFTGVPAYPEEKEPIEELEAKGPVKDVNSNSIHTQINMNNYFYGTSSGPMSTDINTHDNPVHISVSKTTDNRHNCTILIAVNGGSDPQKIPNYNILGENGEHFEYKVVRVLDEPLGGNGLEGPEPNDLDYDQLEGDLFKEQNRSVNNNQEDNLTSQEQINSPESTKITSQVNSKEIQEVEDTYDNEFYIGNKELGAYQYDVHREDVDGTKDLMKPVEETVPTSRTTTRNLLSMTDESKDDSSTENYKNEYLDQETSKKNKGNSNSDAQSSETDYVGKGNESYIDVIEYFTGKSEFLKSSNSGRSMMEFSSSSFLMALLVLAAKRHFFNRL